MLTPSKWRWTDRFGNAGYRIGGDIGAWLGYWCAYALVFVVPYLIVVALIAWRLS